MAHSVSSRWCPTPEQLTILEDMYRSGIKTPNASQIKHTTALLSLYGKIEGKNVFYWFQNHKARDRQKQLRRRLSRFQQLQPQQQNMVETSVLHLSQQNPTGPHHQGGLEEVTQAINFQRNLETTRRQGMEYQPDEGVVLMDMCSTPCYKPPLKTLELFPISSAGLKEKCKAAES